jgi:hypothetical protein
MGLKIMTGGDSSCQANRLTRSLGVDVVSTTDWGRGAVQGVFLKGLGGGRRDQVRMSGSLPALLS